MTKTTIALIVSLAACNPTSPKLIIDSSTNPTIDSSSITDSKIIDSSVDAFRMSDAGIVLDSSIDFPSPKDSSIDTVIDATIDARVVVIDAPTPLDAVIDAGTVTCISSVSLNKDTASFVTTVEGCLDTQSVSILTKVFVGDTLDNSFEQSGVGCGSPAILLLHTQHTITRAEVTFQVEVAGGASGTCTIVP